MPTPPPSLGRRSTRSQNPRLVSLPSTTPRSSRGTPASDPTQAESRFDPLRASSYATNEQSFTRYFRYPQDHSTDYSTDYSSNSIYDDSDLGFGSDSESVYSIDSAAEQLLNEHYEANLGVDNVGREIPHCKDCDFAENAVKMWPRMNETSIHWYHSLAVLLAVLDMLIAVPAIAKLEGVSNRSLLSASPFRFAIKFILYIIYETKLIECQYSMVTCAILRLTRSLGLRSSCPKGLATINTESNQRLWQIVRSGLFLCTAGYRMGLVLYYNVGLLLTNYYLLSRQAQIQKRFNIKIAPSNICSCVLIFSIFAFHVRTNVTQTRSWAFAKSYANHSGGWPGPNYAEQYGVNSITCNPHEIRPATVTWHTSLNKKEAVVTYAPIGCKYLSTETPTTKAMTSQRGSATYNDTSFVVTSSLQKSSANEAAPIPVTRTNEAASISMTSTKPAATSNTVTPAADRKSATVGEPYDWGYLTRRWRPVETSNDIPTKEDVVTNNPKSTFQVESDNIPLSLTETDSSLAVDDPSYASSSELQAPQTDKTVHKSSRAEQSNSPITENVAAPRSSSVSEVATTWTVTDGGQRSTTFWRLNDTWKTRLVEQVGRIVGI